MYKCSNIKCSNSSCNHYKPHLKTQNDCTESVCSYSQINTICLPIETLELEIIVNEIIEEWKKPSSLLAEEEQEQRKSDNEKNWAKKGEKWD